MKRIALIDSHYLCHKAFHATGYLSYEGKRTGVIYGFLNQLITIALFTNPDQFIFFWDSKKSKRQEIYPGYKQKSPKSEFEKQEFKKAFLQFVQLRKKILPYIGFKNNFIQPGYESDDLIAQYVYEHGNTKDLIVVTADNDLLQLLDYCKIFNPSTELIITKDDFIEKYKIKPEQWKEVKKVSGCNSDSVPGVPGVGEKTAIKFLTNDLKKTTKKYKAIINDMKSKKGGVIKRNHDLVVLPFKGTKSVTVQDDVFKMINFLRMCREYGFYSFRTDEMKEKIKTLFMQGEQNEQEKKSKKIQGSKNDKRNSSGEKCKRNKRRRSNSYK